MDKMTRRRKDLILILSDGYEIRGSFAYGMFRTKKAIIIFRQPTVRYLRESGFIEVVKRSEFDYFLRLTTAGLEAARALKGGDDGE